MKGRNLFLLDSIGATVSGLLMFIFVRPNIELFGIPHELTLYLAILALVYASFSGYCYLKNVTWASLGFQIIATANLGYCTLLFTLLLVFRNDITTFGWIYFLLEIIIIGVLALWEFKVAKSF